MEPQGGGEVRRLHIVYFLSRKGRIEHPHLIRVHHLSRTGVRLRDVKRWLAELRGKEIPESFSWSYKRRYKTGYVWQDLLDDDLITPISDNEYVIKGSEISSTNIGDEKEKGSSKQRDEQCEKQSDQTAIDTATKSPSEIEEESPSFGSSSASTLTDDSDTTKHDKQNVRSSSFYSTLLSKKSKKRSGVIVDDKKSDDDDHRAAVGLCKNPTAVTEDQTTKGKCNNSSSASKMLKNLISCGDVETKDSTVVGMRKPSKPLMGMCSSELDRVSSAALTRRDVIGGSQRVFGNPTWSQHQFGRRMSLDGMEGMLKSNSKAAAASGAATAYKGVNKPSCSQCGKQFKPEKMHAHMKSCKGIKALSKCNANGDASSKAASFSSHLLTH